MISLPDQPEGLDTGTQQHHDRSAVSSLRRPRTRSPATVRRLQIKNRRRRYLELHPDYFDSSSHELADPLGYDRFIRRFQTTDEREKEGRMKGYAGVLEADLWRQEAKSAADSTDVDNDDVGEVGTEMERAQVEDEAQEEEHPENKEAGITRWRSKVEQRFLEGRDADFDYESVDDKDEFDDRALEDREEEERWFDEEEAAWADDEQEDDVGVKRDVLEKEHMSGQTGVQDF